ncbi:MAG TPA: hypothetical protein DDY20_04905 [Desulfobulbaceae bacterium]|nr:hypothetical protein [Desulfobulbaceae bacterium]
MEGGQHGSTKTGIPAGNHDFFDQFIKLDRFQAGVISALCNPPGIRLYPGLSGQQQEPEVRPEG